MIQYSVLLCVFLPFVTLSKCETNPTKFEVEAGTFSLSSTWSHPAPSGRVPEAQLLGGRDRGDDGRAHRARGAEVVRRPGLPAALLRRAGLAGPGRRVHLQLGPPQLRHAQAPEDGELPVRR